MKHVPDTHAAGLVHARLHMPQFVFVVASVSQPLDALPSQSARPGAHAVPHTPPAHTGTAPAGAVQARPQAPQFAGFVAVSTQVVPHTVVSPVGHTQRPETHSRAPVQAAPHAPQLAVSRVVSTQRAAAPSPHSTPEVQPQRPLRHAAP